MALAAELVQVAHRQLQHVGFFEFGHVLAFGRQGAAHQLFQFVQASVDARSSLSFQKRLGHLSTTTKKETEVSH